MRGISGRMKIAAVALAATASAMIAWACVSGGGEPTWTLVKPDLDSNGSAAMLLPSNDTRVNLYLLLADRRGATVRDPGAKDDGPPLALFPWKLMAERAVPPTKEAEYFLHGSRCQTNDSGSAEFIAAVQADGRIPTYEKQRLVAARQQMSAAANPVEQYMPDVECKPGPSPDAQLTGLSPEAQEFAAYLRGARAFYGGEFDAAAGDFRALGGASNAWVRETAGYMVARTLLDRAIQSSLTDYGDIADAGKRDTQGAADAGAAFQAYLKAYPSGRYAGSARGLMRRVHWIRGDTGALAADYSTQVSSRASFANTADALALVNEVDNKLPLPSNMPGTIRDPVLLAVVDLHRMRQQADPELRKYCCGPAITRAEIEQQRTIFASDTELYDYVRAAEAFFVRHQPREVLQLIPDAAHQKRFTYLQFSRQMLRGLAREALGDRNSRSYWLSLFSGATRPYQRPAIELALAMHDERAGRLDLVFAPESQVRHPIMREILLQRVAGPALLRQQATRKDVPQNEGEVALYTLLDKDLRRGFYRDFIDDVRWVPADAPVGGYYSEAASYDPTWMGELDRPPLGTFGPKAKLGDFGCPALTATLTQLLGAPSAVRPSLCLAEFFRANGLVINQSEMTSAITAEYNKNGGLGSSRELFPAGRPYARLDVYRSVINNPAASPDEKAFALNRAIRCYAPSHSSDCGGVDVELPVRHGWFDRLKAEYPRSRWAKELKYYW